MYVSLRCGCNRGQAPSLYRASPRNSGESAFWAAAEGFQGGSRVELVVTEEEKVRLVDDGETAPWGRRLY